MQTAFAARPSLVLHGLFYSKNIIYKLLYRPKLRHASLTSRLQVQRNLSHLLQNTHLDLATGGPTSASPSRSYPAAASSSPVTAAAARAPGHVDNGSMHGSFASDPAQGTGYAHASPDAEFVMPHIPRTSSQGAPNGLQRSSSSATPTPLDPASVLHWDTDMAAAESAGPAEGLNAAAAAYANVAAGAYADGKGAAAAAPEVSASGGAVAAAMERARSGSYDPVSSYYPATVVQSAPLGGLSGEAEVEEILRRALSATDHNVAASLLSGSAVHLVDALSDLSSLSSDSDEEASGMGRGADGLANSTAAFLRQLSNPGASGVSSPYAHRLNQPPDASGSRHSGNHPAPEAAASALQGVSWQDLLAAALGGDSDSSTGSTKRPTPRSQTGDMDNVAATGAESPARGEAFAANGDAADNGSGYQSFDYNHSDDADSPLSF